MEAYTLLWGKSSCCPDPSAQPVHVLTTVSSKSSHAEATLKPSLQGHQFRFLCFMKAGKFQKFLAIYLGDLYSSANKRI